MEIDRRGDNSEPTAALQDLVRGLRAKRSIEDVAQLVARTTRSLTSADGVTVVLREGDLCHYFEEDTVSELWKGQRFPAKSCISGWCIQTGQSVVIPDVFADDRIPRDVYRKTFVQGMAMVPVGKGKAIAALGAYWGAGRQIDGKVVEQLIAISSILSPHLAPLKVPG